MKKEYIFDEWKPNPILLVSALCLYVLILTRTTSFYDSILITLTCLVFGWSFSFSKRIIK